MSLYLSLSLSLCLSLYLSVPVSLGWLMWEEQLCGVVTAAEKTYRSLLFIMGKGIAGEFHSAETYSPVIKSFNITLIHSGEKYNTLYSAITLCVYNENVSGATLHISTLTC